MSEEVTKERIEEKLANKLRRSMSRETQDAFKNKAWDGKAWKASRTSDNLLIHSSALLNGTIHTTKGNSIEVYCGLAYANIHNEGGRIPITAKMRRYFWARFIESKASEEHWRAMALTKKKQISIPRRTFVGVSRTTDKNFQRISDKVMEETDFMKGLKLRLNID